MDGNFTVANIQKDKNDSTGDSDAEIIRDSWLAMVIYVWGKRVTWAAATVDAMAESKAASTEISMAAQMGV